MAYGLIDEDVKAKHVAIHKTLQQSQTILGIKMPKGTQLELYKPDQLESFRTAIFPTPVAFGKFQINEVQIPRGIDIEILKDHSVSLKGNGIDTVEGWRCENITYIQVYLDQNAHMTGLEYCTLASPIKLNQMILHDHPDIRRSTEHKYADGFIAHDYWTLSSFIITYKNLSISSAQIYLDKNRKLLGIERGTLLKETTLGNITYPKGTLFNLYVYPLNPHEEIWVFVPPDGQFAKNKNGTTYNDQQAIVQTPKGVLEQVLSTSSKEILLREKML